ncbi:rhodanese-like domain-containing protein [Parasulfuritortus cantonensis]|uniref:Rhodanese-like domain-containing protein n=1 Tax=Parasulfuritortus cantonensis TaxID=2528202 RepID=A0A4V2NVC2_9PROT|nr:rhodanese-like domain-containing protein [Parasulfuritortus cantonensis]TCJ12886.1 rhodanese-like domain-containing protein [Parasulfuritortus cantonensis]
MDFVVQNIWLIMLTAVSGFMLFGSGLMGRLSGIKQVGPQEAVMLFNHQDALVLDVREPSEFKDGHITKAKLVPLGQLRNQLGSLEKYKDKPVVVVCRTGSRSSHACGILRKAGFENVSNLAGGIMAWEQAGLPKEK